MRILRLLVIPIFLAILIFLISESRAQEPEDYFKLENYKTAYIYFSRMIQLEKRPSNPMEHSLLRLAEEFVLGIDAIREEDVDNAIYHLKQARKIVPEYLHADIIIAMLLEGEGEFSQAASFYKSYLLKLKKLQSGFYPISEKFIINTVNFTMPKYEDAKEVIAQRLDSLGIDLDKVSPYPSTAFPLLILLVPVMAVVLYLLSRISYIRQFIYRLKSRLNSNNDLWICTYCGRENANISTSCNNCQKPRP